MKRKALLPALALVLLMLATARYVGRNDVIFPEVAALAFGAWVMDRMPWFGNAFVLWLSPSLAALTGVLVQRGLADWPLAAVPLAFVLVAVELRLCRSGMLPSISAAILPIITQVGSWWYPASVCVLTGGIALGRVALRTPAGPAPDGDAAFDLRHWSKLFLVAAILSTAALVSGWLFLIAPPLFVLFIELSDQNNPARRHPFKVIALITLSATAGSAALFLCAGLPYATVLAAGLALPAVLGLQLATGLRSPPALALALVPAIVPPLYAPVYPLHVAVGCTCFVVASRLFFRQRALPASPPEPPIA